MIDRKVFWSILRSYILKSITFINWKFKFSKKKIIKFFSFNHQNCNVHTVVVQFVSRSSSIFEFIVNDSNCKTFHAFFNDAIIMLIHHVLSMLLIITLFFSLKMNSIENFFEKIHEQICCYMNSNEWVFTCKWILSLWINHISF